MYVPHLRDVVLSRDVLFKPEKLSDGFINVNSRDDSNERREIGIISIENEKEKAESESRAQEPLQASINDSQEKRKLLDRSLIRQTKLYGCPMAFIVQKLPFNYKEAIMSEDKERWRSAIQDEMNSMYDNGTWMLVEKPEDKKVINSRWVFTRKNNLDGPEGYKARFVI